MRYLISIILIFLVCGNLFSQNQTNPDKNYTLIGSSLVVWKNNSIDIPKDSIDLVESIVYYLDKDLKENFDFSNFKNLKKLAVYGYAHTDNYPLIHTAVHLEKLIISGTVIIDERVSANKSLKSIDITSGYFPIGLEHFRDTPLEEFNFKLPPTFADVRPLRPVVDDGLWKITSLKHISLSECYLKEIPLECSLVRLKSISIINCITVGNFNFLLDNENLESITLQTKQWNEIIWKDVFHHLCDTVPIGLWKKKNRTHFLSLEHSIHKEIDRLSSDSGIDSFKKSLYSYLKIPKQYCDKSCILDPFVEFVFSMMEKQSYTSTPIPVLTQDVCFNLKSKDGLKKELANLEYLELNLTILGELDILFCPKLKEFKSRCKYLEAFPTFLYESPKLNSLHLICEKALELNNQKKYSYQLSEQIWPKLKYIRISNMFCDNLLISKDNLFRLKLYPDYSLRCSPKHFAESNGVEINPDALYDLFSKLEFDVLKLFEIRHTHDKSYTELLNQVVWDAMLDECLDYKMKNNIMYLSEYNLYTPLEFTIK